MCTSPFHVEKIIFWQKYSLFSLVICFTLFLYIGVPILCNQLWQFSSNGFESSHMHSKHIADVHLTFSCRHCQTAKYSDCSSTGVYGDLCPLFLLLLFNTVVYGKKYKTNTLLWIMIYLKKLRGGGYNSPTYRYIPVHYTLPLGARNVPVL